MCASERRRFQESGDGAQDVEVPAVLDLGLAESDDCPRDLQRRQEVRCTGQSQTLVVHNGLCEQAYSHLGFRL